MREPMRCPACGATTRRTQRPQRYRYRESGLNNVLIWVRIRHCAKCGETLPEIPNVKALHAVIADALFQKSTSLTGPEIRFVRKEMGLKAKELAAYLGVTQVTVSRWETGTHPIGDSTDRLIRCLYQFHRIGTGREIKPASSVQRFQHELAQIRHRKKPRPLSINIQEPALH